MSILLDSAAVLIDPKQASLDMQMEDARNIREQKERDAEDEKAFKAWVKDDTRVKLYNKLYNAPKESTIIGEVFVTYPENKGSIVNTERSMTGLSVLQENKLNIFPYVKNLHTGEIHTISDFLVHRVPNSSLAEWTEKAASSPSYRKAVPRPPEFVTPLEVTYMQANFRLSKITRKEIPQEHFTFSFEKFKLLPGLKKSK